MAAGTPRKTVKKRKVSLTEETPEMDEGPSDTVMIDDESVAALEDDDGLPDSIEDDQDFDGEEVAESYDQFRDYTSDDDQFSYAPDGTDNDDQEDDRSEEEVGDEQTEDDEVTPFQRGSVLRVTRKQKKYPWAEMEQWFIEGEEKYTTDGKPDGRSWPTQAEVAERYGASQSRISEHATKHRWKDKRAVFMKRVDEDRRKDRIDELSRAAVDLDNNSLNAAKMGVTIAQMKLAQMGNDLREHAARVKELTSMGLPITSSELKSPVDARELDATASALQRFYDVGRTALGEDVVKHEISGSVLTQIGIDVREQMGRDDPDRIEEILMALAEAGIVELGEEPVDGEVVDDQKDNTQPKEIEA